MTNKLKILTVVCDLNKGGTQRAAQVFAEAYKEMGHDSRILSFYGGGSRYEELKDFIKIWIDLSAQNLEEIKEWSPNIVHIHSNGLQKNDVLKFLKIIKNQATKTIEQNVFSTPSPWEDQVDLSFQFSKWALWIYLMRGGDSRKAEILPNPVQCQNFKKAHRDEVIDFKQKYNIPENSYVIGRIGQSDHAKWSEMMIDVFDETAKKKNNIYLLLVNPPLNVIKKSHHSKFKDKIVIIDRIIGDKNLSTAYSCLDLMIHVAEKGESFGYVLAEALLCETPVITLSTPWADNSQIEVAPHLKGSYVVSTKKELIEAINAHVKDPRKIQTERGKEHIIENYDANKIANKAVFLTFNQSTKFHQLKDINQAMIQLLNNSANKPGLITKFIIKNNLFYLRKILLYKYPIKYLKTEIKKRIHLKISKLSLNKTNMGFSKKQIKLFLNHFYFPLLTKQAIKSFAQKRDGVKTPEEAFSFSNTFYYGPKIRGLNINIVPAQFKKEIIELIEVVKTKKPATILEIGTATGGALFFWSQFCPVDAHLISIDLPFGQFGAGYLSEKGKFLQSLARETQKLNLIQGNSHHQEIKTQLAELLQGKKIDFLFIDGDHSYEGVKQDFLDYKDLVSPEGIIAFHDIKQNKQDPYCQVPLFWNEIKGQYKFQELSSYENQNGCGIGYILI
jgi:glycosyltransferase involved in cell wall biosynthesis/cephalosporin hydroxylase